MNKKLFIFIIVALTINVGMAQAPFINLSNTSVRVCNGDTSASFYFTSTTGDAYSIKATGNAAFLNMPDFVALPSTSPIVINFSSATTAGIYSANLYVRNVTDTSVAYPISVLVLPTFKPGSIDTAGQIACPNAQLSTINSIANASGGDGIIAYKWQRNGTDISAGSMPVYMPTDSGTYTRLAKDEMCNMAWTLSGGNYTVTIYPTFTSGSIATASGTVCLNAEPEQIDSIEAASGGNGTITYRWKVNGSEIFGANNATYTPPVQTTAGIYNYTREAKDATCANWTASEGLYQLIVNAFPSVPQQPAGAVEICQGLETLEYGIASATNAESYIWDLSPASAGSVSGNGDTVSVFWNLDYIGTAYLKVKAKNACGESAYSESLAITVMRAPKVQFIQAPNPVCANQKELLYSVENINNATYQWTIERGSITSEIAQNKILVDWDRGSAESTGKITVAVTDNTSGCLYTASLLVAMAAGNAPDLNAIADKKHNGVAYMLVYPNTMNENLAYQWYKNGVAVSGASEQFFYPENYNQTLDNTAEYKVFVSLKDNQVCGNFTNAYEFQLTGKNAGKEITISPNPVKDNMFTIQISETIDLNGNNNLLTITSLSGEKLWEQKVSGANRYNISIARQLPKGIYIVTLKTANEMHCSERIVIE